MRIFYFFLSISFFVANGCGLLNRQEAARDLSPLFEALASEKKSTRDSARAALDNQLFLSTDLPVIFAALDRSYPDDSLQTNSTRQKLLAILREVHNPETTVFLEGLYPRLRQYPAHASTALSVLVLRNSEPAGRVFLDALEKGPPFSQVYFEAATSDFFDHPVNLQHVFPRLLGFRKVPAYRSRILELTALGLEKEAITPQSFKDSLPALLDFYSASYVRCLDSPNPAEACDNCADVLRIMSFYPEDRRCWTIMDEVLADEKAPHLLRLTALEASLKGDLPIGNSTLELLARDMRTRNRTYQLLTAHGKTDRFSPGKQKQLALAEGDLAVWLSSPEQKGRIPSDIELLERRREKEVEGNLYVFRFRYGDEWQIGISGPQPADTTQAVAIGTLTGSRFTPEKEKSLDDHIQALLEEM